MHVLKCCKINKTPISLTSSMIADVAFPNDKDYDKLFIKDRIFCISQNTNNSVNFNSPPLSTKESL